MKKITLIVASLSVLFLSGCRDANLKKTYIQEIDISISDSTPNATSINLKSNQLTTEEFSDITFALNEQGFIVITPENGATGVYLRTLPQYDTEHLQNSLEECHLRENEFLQGGKPLTTEGDTFCLKTNSGIYVLIIKRFFLAENEIKITIQHASY